MTKDWRPQRIILFEQQNGLCFWCRRKMFMPTVYPKGGGRFPSDLATVDHLHCKLDPVRRANKTVVAACYECNQKRNISEEQVKFRQQQLDKSRYYNRLRRVNPNVVITDFPYMLTLPAKE